MAELRLRQDFSDHSEISLGLPAPVAGDGPGITTSKYKLEDRDRKSKLRFLGNYGNSSADVPAREGFQGVSFKQDLS
jgi:hypothetical protein